MHHRVLFFVEPYCVRSGPEDFRTPFEFFSRIAVSVALHPGIETAMVCSSHFARLAPRALCCLTPSQFGVDESPDSRWSENWPKMLRGEPCPPWDDFYARATTEFRPTLALAWNKNSLFAQTCRAADVALVTLEYGSIRTPSGFRISCDPLGFGPESALSTTTFTADMAEVEAGWAWAATHVLGDALHMRRAGRRRSADEIHACVLLQKEDDVNFLVWPAFDDMWDFVQHVLGELSREADVRVSVRPHPAGLENYDQRIALRFPTVNVERDGATYYERLSDYDCVFTLNSAAGLEALLCRIPTMTFSASAYPCAFSRERDGDIAAFLRQVRKREFWTESRVQRVGQFAHRLVRHYSIPQELLTEPTLYIRLIERWSHMAASDLQAWFEATPPRLAAEVAACGEAILETQLGALRFQNSRRAGETHQLSQRIDGLHEAFGRLQSELRSFDGAALEPLLRQVHTHVEALAEMTRQNQNRDHAISAATTELHRQSRLLDELARRTDESGAQIQALLEQVHLQSRMLAEIWGLLRPAATSE